MSFGWLIKKIRSLFSKSDSNEQELYIFILETFKEMKSEVLSAKIVYSQLRLLNPNLFRAVTDITDYEKFWDYLKTHFSGKLYFSKPFVSSIPFTNTLEVTENYLKTLDGFDNKTIIDFESRIGLESSKGSSIFINRLSDEFVQIDETMMLKKDIFNINNMLLKRIKNTLDLYFKNNELLDTREFKAYFTFPEITGYKWNKYLLTGIIRTYFKNGFYIEKVSNDTNYIIRRIDNHE